jgi:hypothetical protein
MSENAGQGAAGDSSDKERWWRRAAVLGTWADAAARMLEIIVRGR